MPELKGRNLEEIDQLFDAKVPAWRFSRFETTGPSHDVAVMFSGRQKAEEANISAGLEEHIEDVQVDQKF